MNDCIFCKIANGEIPKHFNTKIIPKYLSCAAGFVNHKRLHMIFVKIVQKHKM